MKSQLGTGTSVKQTITNSAISAESRHHLGNTRPAVSFASNIEKVIELEGGENSDLTRKLQVITVLEISLSLQMSVLFIYHCCWVLICLIFRKVKSANA